MMGNTRVGRIKESPSWEVEAKNISKFKVYLTKERIHWVVVTRRDSKILVSKIRASKIQASKVSRIKDPQPLSKHHNQLLLLVAPMLLVAVSGTVFLLAVTRLVSPSILSRTTLGKGIHLVNPKCPNSKHLNSKSILPPKMVSINNPSTKRS